MKLFFKAHTYQTILIAETIGCIFFGLTSFLDETFLTFTFLNVDQWKGVFIGFGFIAGVVFIYGVIRDISDVVLRKLLISQSIKRLKDNSA